MEYGLIGEHLPHSFSKEIHNRLGNPDYILKELTPEEVDGFMRAKDFKGINVTIPYKQTVIPYLDEISDAARAIGAVNTIVNRNGRLIGYNTDFGGMKALILHLGLELKGKKVLILGTGGTSKTAKAVAEDLGAAFVAKVSRRVPGDGAATAQGNATAEHSAGADKAQADVVITYEEACRDHSDAQIIINTTPVGMFPNIDAAPIDLDLYPNVEGVIDAIYNPLRTRLILQAEEKEIKAAGGLYMLVGQAVLASEYFLDTEYVNDELNKVYKAILAEKQNLVLIGMPSCGKSTVGKKLKLKLNRELVDTDRLIVDKDGRTIPEIFAQEGEPGFRDIESEVIMELAPKNGMIIATGGGAILRPENVKALKANGRLVFLDRKLENLITTSDRPLSSDIEALRKRYEERYPIYCRVADMRVYNNGILGATVRIAAKALGQDGIQ